MRSGEPGAAGQVADGRILGWWTVLGWSTTQLLVDPPTCDLCQPSELARIDTFGTAQQYYYSDTDQVNTGRSLQPFSPLFPAIGGVQIIGVGVVC